MNCPHWRSVFSSVFKEPKLGTSVHRGERLGALAFPAGEPSVKRKIKLSVGEGRNNP